MTSTSYPQRSEHRNNLLQARGLAKRYRRRTVVRAVDIDVFPGEIVGLLGPNGAGKTTTFRILMGIIRPDGGVVRLSGKDITRMPLFRRARSGMGYLAQEPTVFQNLTVEENMLAVLEVYTRDGAAARKRAGELLGEFGLTHLKKSKAYTLSGGERRRLEIARALSASPALILLDEPFSGVDPKAVSEIQDIVIHLKQRGIGIVLTDHSVRETLSITDRAYLIHEGTILCHGTPDELVANEEVRQVYLGERFRM
ncbi:MAG: LPS export ABC transporter ATP-binding protein [Planctomycetota bacterium]